MNAVLATKKRLLEGSRCYVRFYHRFAPPRPNAIDICLAHFFEVVAPDCAAEISGYIAGP